MWNRIVTKTQIMFGTRRTFAISLIVMSPPPAAKTIAFVGVDTWKKALELVL